MKKLQSVREADESSKEDTPPILNTKKAAAYLGTTPNVLRLSRHTGEIRRGLKAPKYVLMGKSVFYKRSDLEEFLESLPYCENTADAKVQRLI